MRQLTTEAEATAAQGGTPPDTEAALVAVAALDPKTTGEGQGWPLSCMAPPSCGAPSGLCWQLCSLTVPQKHAG